MLLRPVVTLVVVLAALRLFLPPFPLDGANPLQVWFGAACGIGFVLACRWALLLAPLPLVGWWYTVSTGPEYLTYGDRVPVLWETIIILIGLCGIVLGRGIRGWLTGFLIDTVPLPARTANVLPLAGVLVLIFGVAALDWSRGGVFVRPPSPLEPKRYSEDWVRADTAGLGYAVYAAPASEGLPRGAFRSTSAPPGVPPADRYSLTYCDAKCHRTSEVQVLSEHPDLALAARQWTGSKPTPADQMETLEFAGAAWEVQSTGRSRGPFTASANLGDAYVTIHTPNRSVFERVAAGLRRVNRENTGQVAGMVEARVPGRLRRVGRRSPNRLVDRRLGFHLHFPAWIEQAGDDDHRRCRAHLAEDRPVRPTHHLAVGGIGDEHPRADHLLGTRPGLAQRGEDDLQAALHLSLRVRVAGTVRPDRRGAGDQHAIADTDGPAEADGRLIRRTRGDALTLGSHDLFLLLRCPQSNGQ